jgi:hypothetical protein
MGRSANLGGQDCCRLSFVPVPTATNSVALEWRLRRVSLSQLERSTRVSKFLLRDVVYLYHFRAPLVSSHAKDKINIVDILYHRINWPTRSSTRNRPVSLADPAMNEAKRGTKCLDYPGSRGI